MQAEVHLNVVFICGTLEPGRDGVGDYTMKLASAITKLGHTASILSLNDGYIDNNLDGGLRSNIDFVNVLRLSDRIAERARCNLAINWIEEIRPTWLSLQFVPFSFQNKGLPFRLISLLKRIGKGYRWQIMFHELWVGMSDEASTKHKIWGWLQRNIVRGLLKQLAPAMIHTQCRLYLAQLEKLSLNVGHLPLFSNIPVVPNAGGDSDNASITLIIFGTIHPGASLSALLGHVETFTQRHNRTFKFVFVGRCGYEQENWISAARKGGIEVEVIGEREPGEISILLGRANIGISTTALPLIDKSGTVAAMLEHSLPIICVGQNWTPRGVQIPAMVPGIYTLEEGCIEACLEKKRAPIKFACASGTAIRFINELTLHN